MLYVLLKLMLVALPIVQSADPGKPETTSDQIKENRKKYILGSTNSQKNVLQYPTGFATFLPELQDEKLGVFNEKQTYPRIQPQVFLYTGLAPGQQFLVHPATPPNNFLVPQPQPGTDVVLRDTPPFLTPAGYPRPAHVPAVEKDAEEIPTDQVGVHRPAPRKKVNKPEKLETLDTDNDKIATEAEVLAEADRNFVPSKPTTTNLKPGQRFFFLNGQTLFPAFPHEGLNQPNYFFNPFQFFNQGPQGPAAPEKQSEPGENVANFPLFNQGSLENLQRNPITGHNTNVKELDQKDQNAFFFNPENSVLLNQPLRANDRFFSGIYDPFTISNFQIPEGNLKEAEKENQKSGKQTDSFTSLPDGYSFFGADINHIFGSGFFPGLNGRQLSANIQQNQGVAQAETPEGNPTISDAQPGTATGKGEVANSTPRTTTPTGKRGTAAASPQATSQNEKSKVTQKKS